MILLILAILVIGIPLILFLYIRFYIPWKILQDREVREQAKKAQDAVKKLHETIEETKKKLPDNW